MLAGGGLLAIAGCLPAEPAPGFTVSPEQRVRVRIAGEVAELAARYDAVVARHSAAGSELATLSAEHRAHVVALLGPDAARRRGRRPGATPSPSATSPTASPVPGTLAEARADLTLAELAASRRRGRQARDASPALARLLSSIAACEAAHAALLEQQ